MTKTFRCTSCGQQVTEPMILNGLPLCEECSNELAATGYPLQGLRQPPVEAPRPRRSRHD